MKYNEELLARFMRGEVAINLKTSTEWEEFCNFIERYSDLKWAGQKSPMLTSVWKTYREESIVVVVTSGFIAYGSARDLIDEVEKISLDCLFTENDPNPIKVTFNSDDGTTLLEMDGRRTLVTIEPEEEFDKFNGFAIAFAKHHLGSTTATKRIVDKSVNEGSIQLRNITSENLKFLARRAEDNKNFMVISNNIPVYITNYKNFMKYRGVRDLDSLELMLVEWKFTKEEMAALSLLPTEFNYIVRDGVGLSIHQIEPREVRGLWLSEGMQSFSIYNRHFKGVGFIPIEFKLYF